jgi:hypothetical protein
MDIQAAKNHLRLWMDYHGPLGTMDGAVVAQAMAAIVQAEAALRQAVALEELVKNDNQRMHWQAGSPGPVEGYDYTASDIAFDVDREDRIFGRGR